MLFAHHLQLIFRQLLATLWPRQCSLCDTSTTNTFNLCASCLIELPILTHVCQQCASPLPQTMKQCGSCLKKDLPFTRTHALFHYQPPISHMLLALKFHGHLLHAHTFAHLFLKKIQSTWYTNHHYPDVILPVPLHTQRLRERGFNQALEIARPIGRHLQIPLDRHGIKRVIHTAAQMTLPAAKRQQNVARAFTAQRQYTGLTVAIVDDVITTGHTVNAIAKLLKVQGAKAVHIWSCARK